MRKILSSLLAILAIANLQAQQQAPKLVVYITIDQLRGDYIDYFYHTFGERGFKRLINEGTVYHNVSFEYPNVSQANAYATLYTGSNPCDHGITSDLVYEFYRDREVSPLFDPEYLGNFTRDNYSPKKLLTSTIGDELKIASNGASEVYSIAPDAESAIISAGHAANAAYWIDNYNGKWATTTFYKGVSSLWYIDRYNNGNESLPVRMNSMVWKPTLSIDQYTAFPYVKDKVNFNHTFRANTVDCYPRIKSSPFGNKEVNRLVFQFLEYAAFGTRPNPDMLAISYYAGNYFDNMSKEYTFEMQDLYIHLDKDIEELLDMLDKKVGLKNVLIVMSGTGYYKGEEIIPAELQVVGGEFNTNYTLAILNMFLKATYGDKNWIKGYYNNQIYFNRKIIEDSDLVLADFQQKSADLLYDKSGVARVTTDMALRSGIWNDVMADLHKGTHFAGRGDLILNILPGWRIVTEKPGEKVKNVRNNAVQTPVVFMGAGIKPQRIYREIKATEIAPTITHILRIRPPNASKNIPLYEVYR
ncbi:MAG: alkaline phosphatase family protein [Tannerella sp.]|jgi:hypothetical protein|nr:alkaline phosphatase family protein [Tannerella sp.]